MLQQATWNHDKIREWAERHGATPVELCSVVAEAAELTLGFNFGSEQPSASAVSWRTFFSRFDSLGLFFAADEQDDTYSIFFEPGALFGM